METYLCNLPDKATFEIIGLEGKFRNLRLLRVTEGGCLIRGEINNASPKEPKQWTPLGLNYCISRLTLVKRVFND